MAQVFHSKKVVNSILRKNLKLYEERLHQRSCSSSQIHKRMSRYKKTTSKYWLLYCHLKMFLSVDINSEVIEAAARNCSLKKFLFKKFEKKYRKNCEKIPLLESLFCKTRLKEEKKRNSSTSAFP